MANRQNTRRIAHVKRETRRDGRRTATRQIRRGDWDNMASGEPMIRTTPVEWAERDSSAATAPTTNTAEYDSGSSRWEV